MTRKTGLLVKTVNHVKRSSHPKPDVTTRFRPKKREKQDQRGIIKSRDIEQLHSKRRVEVNCQNRDSCSCLALRGTSHNQLRTTEPELEVWSAYPIGPEVRASVWRCWVSLEQNTKNKKALLKFVCGIAAKETPRQHFFCGTASGNVLGSLVAVLKDLPGPQKNTFLQQSGPFFT